MKLKANLILNFTHTLKTIFLSIAIFVSACQKDLPVANFISNKTEYMAGDTIHLINASENAYHWKWTLPNGDIRTEKDVNYVFDKNDDGGVKIFCLEVSNKKDKRKSSIFKSFNLTPYSWFSPAGYNIKSITTGVNGYNYVVSAFSDNRFHISDPYNSETCKIYLPGNTLPTSPGTYSLQESHDSLTAGKACVFVQNYDGETFHYSCNVSTSGSLTISFRQNGQLRIIFNNVIASHYNNIDGSGQPFSTSNVLSGDLTVSN